MACVWKGGEEGTNGSQITSIGPVSSTNYYKRPMFITEMTPLRDTVGTGKRGTLGKRACSQSLLVIDFSMLATPRITPLLVNLKDTTTKPKIKKAVHYFAYTSEVTMGFFYGVMHHMGRGAAPLQISPRVFEHFLALAIPGEKGGGCLYCIFKMRANKRLVQGG